MGVSTRCLPSWPYCIILRASTPDTPDFEFGVSSAFETASVHSIVFYHRLMASFLISLNEYSELRRTYLFTVFVLSSGLSETHIFPLSAFLVL